VSQERADMLINDYVYSGGSVRPAGGDMYSLVPRRRTRDVALAYAGTTRSTQPRQWRHEPGSTKDDPLRRRLSASANVVL